MPARMRRIGRGKNKGKYTVRTPKGVHAKATTKTKAKRQQRLLNAIEHGWKPTKSR